MLNPRPTTEKVGHQRTWTAALHGRVHSRKHLHTAVYNQWSGKECVADS